METLLFSPNYEVSESGGGMGKLICFEKARLKNEVAKAADEIVNAYLFGGVESVAIDAHKMYELADAAAKQHTCDICKQERGRD